MDTSEILLYNSLSGLHLLEKQPKKEILHDLLGIQSQFSSYAQMSLFLRCSDYDANTYGDGLAKIWSHRGTMHLVSESDLWLHLSALDISPDFEDGARGISRHDSIRCSAFIMNEISRGNFTRDGLKEACRHEGMSPELLERVFYGWGGLVREMVMRGMIVGNAGNSKEYRLSPVGEAARMSRDDARLSMLRTYFEHYGPASIADCKYFFGNWKKPEINRLTEILMPALLATEIDGITYYHKHPLITEAELPPCVLVPGFDQLVLGYKDRSRMIDGKHLKKLTNISGIICPTVIVRGKMRASWKVVKGSVVVTPFEHLYKKDMAVIDRKIRSCFGRRTVIQYEAEP